MKKRGFTLVEVIGVIIILGVLALIAVPTVNIIIKNSKEKSLQTTIRNLEEAAYDYSNRYDIGYSSETKILQISELKEKGYVKNETIINPVTNSELKGCILYRWDGNNKQYQFDYDEECIVRNLEVNITNLDGIFNENGWAKQDFYVNIETTGTSYNYCIANKECSPSARFEKSNGSAYVTIEGDNVHVCVYANYGKTTSEIVCSEVFKLDKTAPTAGTINITGSKGENNWYTSDVAVKVIDGTDSLSGHLITTVEPMSINEDTTGKKVLVTTKDKADNISTREYTIKVDKGEPSVTIAKTVVDNKNVLNAITNNVTSGYSYEWYKDGNIIEGQITSSLTTTEAGKYKLKVTTGSGKSIESNEIEIKQYTIAYNLNGGTGSISNTNKVQDITSNITSTIPKRDGYTFLGWGISTTDINPTYLSGDSYTLNESKTLYAIWKKGYTLTFVGNGATISTTTVGCEIYNAETSCNVTTPTITRSGYTIIGFSTNKDATTKDINQNSTISISNDVTYYAITSKLLTATFVANNATLVDTSNTDSNTKDTCTMYNTATSCTVYSPSITAPSNTPTVLGFNTSASSTSSAWSVNTAKSISNDVTYYAITTKPKTTYTITYSKGIGVSAVGSTSGTCSIDATYNGTAQTTTCNITLPSITASTGYGNTGWYNSSNKKLGNAEATISVSASQTITAKATQITCIAGYYLAANATSCTKCEAGSYCAGGAYTFTSSTQGKSTCPSGYGSSVAGSDAASDCYLTTTAGKYIATANSSTQTTCTSGYYCPGKITIQYGSTGGRTSCPSGYGSSAAGSDAANDCYKTITVSYSGNGSTSGSTSSSSCNAYYGNSSCSITLNSNGFSRTNYTFQGWGTGTSSVTHNASTAYNFSSNTTLNAIWKVNYICSTGTLTYDSSKGYICVGGYNDGSGAVATGTSCNSCTYNTTTYGQHSSCGYASCDVTTTTSPNSSVEYYCSVGQVTSGSGSSTVCTVSGTLRSKKEYYCSVGQATSGSGASTVCTVFGNVNTQTTKECLPPSYQCTNWSGTSHNHCITGHGTSTCPSGYVYKDSTTCVESSVQSCYGDKKCEDSKKTTPRICTEGGTVFMGNGIAADDVYIGQCLSYSSPTTTTTYTCDSGYTKNGSGSSTTCTKSGTLSSKTVYYCDSGYTQNGSGSSSTCTKSGTLSSKTVYSCPTGYSSSGSGSSMTCSKTETKKDSSCGYASCYYTTSTYGSNCSSCGSYTYYYCPSGWSTYSGSDSSLKCYKAATKNN